MGVQKRVSAARARRAGFVGFIGLVLLLVASAVPVRSDAASPAVQALLFFSQTCPHCEVVRNDVLPVILDKYGDKLEVKELDITDPRNFDMMLGFEAMYQIPQDQVGIPELFVGSDYLIGENAFSEKFQALVDKYLAQGGVEYPVLAEAAQTAVSATPGSSTPVTPAVASQSADSAVAPTSTEPVPTPAPAETVAAPAPAESRAPTVAPAATGWIRWVQGVAAAVCWILAFVSLLDYLRLRRAAAARKPKRTRKTDERRSPQVLLGAAIALFLIGAALLITLLFGQA